VIRFALVVLFTVLVLVFGLANLHVVELKTVFGGAIRASMAFLLIGAFGVGFAVAGLFGAHRSLASRSHNRQRMSKQSEPERPMLPPPPQIFVRDSRYLEP